MIRMKNDEYRKLRSNKRNIFSSTRATSSLHKNYHANEIDAVCKLAIQALYDIQGISGIRIFGKGNISIRTRTHSKTRADGTNILKGVEDALNRIAYEDDKQARRSEHEFI